MTGLEEHGLRVVPVCDADPAAVLRFELANRAYFRRWVGDRGDGYYDLAAVAESIAVARRWWEAGSDRMHVAVTTTGDVVARVNLVDIADGCADLGYRVAEDRAGRGVATMVVTEVLHRAPGWRIGEVRAVTRHDNLASARVLERCGFSRVGTRSAALEPDRRAVDVVDWAATLTLPPSSVAR